MSNYFNQKFYKSSYYLEFRYGADVQGIAFSLPPQSEEFSFPQRIGETKTFGGAVFEDYGNDSGKITLSGSTVNSEVRIIYSSDGNKFLDGETEIFNIKNIIDSYGKKDRLGKKVFLYALSGKKTNKYWQVVINDFSIKRNKDKPMAYDYTLTCTIIQDIETSKYATWLDKFQTNVRTLCDKINTSIEFLENGLGYYRQGLEYVEVIKDCVNKFIDELNGYVNILVETMDITTNYIEETVNLGDTVISFAERISLGNSYNLCQAALNLNQAVNDLHNYINGIDEDDISTDLQEMYNSSAEKIKYVWIEESKGVSSATNEIVADTELQLSILDYTTIPGDNGTSDAVVLVYGNIDIITNDTDTWDSISMQYYNTPNYGASIALYNGLRGFELKPGTKLKLPIINKKEKKISTNLIYSAEPNESNYGTDIEGSSGDIGIFQNDLATISGVKNLDQAITYRLQTAINSRIRNTVYGIRASIGTISEAENYLLASIQNTLLEDPRVKSIEELSYKGKGDSIEVYIRYVDINNEKQNYGGII